MLGLQSWNLGWVSDGSVGFGYVWGFIKMNGFDYGTQLADLTSKYASDRVAQNFGRMLGQQRFKRQKQDLTRSYRSQFPKFTGSWAGRLGPNIKSGVFKKQLADQRETDKQLD